MARYSSRQYGEALFLSLQENPEEQDKVLENFAKILVKNNDRSLAPKIIRQLQKNQRNRAGEHTVIVTTAKKASPELIKQIQAKFHNKAQIKEEVDPAVLGGLKLLINDEEVIDSTLKSRVEKLLINN